MSNYLCTYAHAYLSRTLDLMHDVGHVTSADQPDWQKTYSPGRCKPMRDVLSGPRWRALEYRTKEKKRYSESMGNSSTPLIEY